MSIRLVVLFCTFIFVLRADQSYYWRSTQVDGSAELLTLFSHDVPLVEILRDKLGREKISNVWLLTYSRPNLGQRALSAVPFFYWKVASGSTKVKKSDLKPLINMALPQRTVVRSSVRNLIQWTVLDPISMPVRASTRAYQTNKHDNELLHLEEAKGYLQAAPTSYLTDQERDTIIARLDLRSRMLGEFVSAGRAAQLGRNTSVEEESIRAKNWELLRQCADKTRLIFEPINLAGTRNQYAILWQPADRIPPPPGTQLGPIWKLLNIKEPSPSHERIPLGVYSLTYPRMPLLLVDFRDATHLKRHELTQRAINEITSGVIGLSRFTNWYYFVAADLYQFWESRRGTATNQQERMNAYSKFRVALALDRTLDGDLRATMQKLVNAFSVNPLAASAKNEFQAAQKRYDFLQSAAADENGPLIRRLEKDRRAELAIFEASKFQQIRADVFHYSTLGLYTRRANGADFANRLARYRQVEYYLAFLDTLSAPGTAPEVAQDPARIQRAVAELTLFLPDIQSPKTHARAEEAIAKLQGLSADAELRARCGAALEILRGTADASSIREGSGVAESLQ